MKTLMGMIFNNLRRKTFKNKKLYLLYTSKSSRGGLVVERSLPNSRWLPISVQYGVSIVQNRKLFVAIHIAEHRAFGFMIHA